MLKLFFAVFPMPLIYAGAEQLYDGRLWGSPFKVETFNLNFNECNV